MVNFGLKASTSSVADQHFFSEPEFFVRTLYDGFPLKFKFCRFKEFCELSRFMEFLDLNMYNSLSDEILKNLAGKV